MDKFTETLETSSPLVLSVVALGLSSVAYIFLRSASGPPKGFVYPPGPPQEPIIGSFRSFPQTKFSQTFNSWQKLYGDIVYIRLPGVSMMIINSFEMAHELLSKRGTSISARTLPYMAQELLGFGWVLPLRQADSVHQLQRKMLLRGIGPQRVVKHDSIIEKCTNQLLLDLKELQGDPSELILDHIGHIIIELTYGEEIWEKHGHDLAKLNLEAMAIADGNATRVWLVDIFPFLRFLPSWTPGAEFKRLGIYSTKLITHVRNWPFAISSKLYESKRLGPSLAADLFEEFGQTDETRDALAVLYLFGSDTTSSAVVHFLHAMFIFPEITAKVQREIDTVTGGHLPKVTDRPHLKYTEAVWKEALRWNTAIPLAIPHTSLKDETINGFFIPKGSLIHPNLGFMLNDPKIWGDPEVFRPERHLENHDPPLPSPTAIIFGFGPRICPGRELANRSGFYVATTIMAVYDILPFEGRSRPDPSTVEYTDKTIKLPKDFECRFIPRNKNAANVLSSLALS